MEPLTAISVAAAVVQFVDFGSRLLRDTVEVYRSPTGQSRDTLNIASISRELSALGDEVESKSKALELLHGEDSEGVFVRLCRSCKDLGEEMNEFIGDVGAHIAKNPKSAVRSFFSVLRERWSEDKIEMLRSKLSQLQQRMTAAALVFLW